MNSGFARSGFSALFRGLSALAFLSLACLAFSGSVQAAESSLVSPDKAAHTLWGEEQPAATLAAGDTQSVELGVRFRSEVDGLVDEVRFFRQAPIHRGYSVHIWTAQGELLGSARSVEGQQPTPGWQIVQLWPPVPIKAGTEYVASYHADFGQYSVTREFFTDRPIGGGALRTAGGRGSGVYAYGEQSVFPAKTDGASNYWIDVRFRPVARQ